MDKDVYDNIKNIAIIVDRNVRYYIDLMDFLNLYKQPLPGDSFIRMGIKNPSTASYYTHIILYGSIMTCYWSGNSGISNERKQYHLYRDRDELDKLFQGKNYNKLTLDEIKELKKTIWVKLNSEQEIKKAYDLLVKYNQLMYKDKNGIPLLIGSDYIYEGYLGMNMKTNPEFGVWSNNSHNSAHTEEIKVKHNFIIDNLELLEHLFKQEEELLNK